MTDTRKAGYSKDDKFYVWCRDHYEMVSKEVYDIIMQDEWREAKRRQREWRCRDGKGFRCNIFASTTMTMTNSLQIS